MKQDNVTVFIGVLMALVIFAGCLVYAKFQWDECRKDKDHTFWHCVQVLD